ncbi:MAG: NUDIX domain-containing protein [Deltaproteobacteria bacterium]|nr:NUDIX domain-containing protein [Deltaproteobacteria bacterium]
MKRGVIFKFVFLSFVLFSTAPVFAVKVCLENLRKIADARRDLAGRPSLISPVVILYRGDEVLLGKRKSSQAWGFPGGALEHFDKTLEEGAAREVREETGLEIKNLRLFGMVEEFVEERQRNYFIMLFKADVADSLAIAQVTEPEKHTEWKWYSPYHLPSPLFKPNENLLAGPFNPFKSR